MSRLLTLLLLYKNGYSVGKYISIEKQIEKTKDRYYDTLEESDAGWHEEENDPTPFIRYMLQVILACYTEFEERVGLMTESRNGSTAYDIVKRYTEEKIGKFMGADVVAHCPSIGRSSALAALKKLTEEGLIIREGSGRSSCGQQIDFVQKSANLDEKKECWMKELKKSFCLLLTRSVGVWERIPRHRFIKGNIHLFFCVN